MKNINKNSDKFLLKTLFLSVFCALVCAIMLCSATYAWVTASVESDKNIIEGSRFALSVNVKNESNAEVEATSNLNGLYTYSFDKTGTYTVVLEIADESTASKGYCQIMVNDIDKYQTEVISESATDGIQTLTFKIKIESAATITFEPKLGISSNVNVNNNAEITIPNLSSN